MIQRLSLRHFGGWLALAAVTLQLALSYGHIHSELLAKHAPTGIELSRNQAPSPAAPSGDPADKACEICATMALAGALLFPDPVLLPVPAETDIAVAAVATEFTLQANPYVLYRTRAPPLV